MSRKILDRRKNFRLESNVSNFATDLLQSHQYRLWLYTHSGFCGMGQTPRYGRSGDRKLQNVLRHFYQINGEILVSSDMNH